MALVNGTNYDHVDLQSVAGGDITRHMYQDTAGRAMLAPTEASSTASMAHVPGTDSEFFVYQNKLYKATVSIAQGGTITPNTNCKEAPLGAAVSDLKSAVDIIDTKTKAPIIINSASGSLASFEDGADGLPVKKLVAQIEPIQDGSGDPAPDNVRPITGRTAAKVTRCGKNFYDINSALRAASNQYGARESNTGKIIDGYYYFGGAYGDTPGANIPVYLPKGLNYRISFRDIINNAQSTKLYFIRWFGKNLDEQTKIATMVRPAPDNIEFNATANYADSFTMNKNAQFYVPIIQCLYELGYYKIASSKIQIELGNTTTPYEPYHGVTVSVEFPDEAGTVYGGTLTINEDGTGELRARPYYAEYNGETLVGPWLSSMDVYTPGTTPTIGAQVVDLGGVETVYPLASIPTITTLYGLNNIFSDCGDVEVEYRADTKLYIQKINTPADDDMTADSQISSGKYFIIGGNLYRSTTTIPAGDTITPGTNCILTNLAEALNALNN